MKRVLCFGEILLSMTHSSYQSWMTETAMSVCLGGSELNVASALARWKVPVTYFTAMPDNFLSESVLMHLSTNGIEVEPVLRTGNRFGICYLKDGTDLKDPLAFYDRSNSSFSSLKPGMIDWDKALTNVSFLHFSAIPPALNENIAAVCKEAVIEACKKNITISIDLNYRASLWKNGRDPLKVLEELVNYCTIIMGNIWSANALLGVSIDSEIHIKASHSAYLDHARQTAREIRKKYPKCNIVANTFRFDNDQKPLGYFATLDTAYEQYQSKYYTSSAIRNKVGSGDCFMAGLIYGMYEKLDPQQTIEFATKAAFLKMHELGDTTKNTIEIIKSAKF